MKRVAIGVGRAACLALASQLPLGTGTAAIGGGDDFRLLELDGYHVKWGDTTLGAGAVVTYAIIRTPSSFPDARNCGQLVPLDDLAARHRIAEETLHEEVAAAFRVWEAAADLRFVRVEGPDEANILIGAQGTPVGRAFANVAYRPGAEEAIKSIEQSLVCLNPEQRWKVGFDGDTEVYDIRYTLIHEIGHAIGLDHPGPSGQFMSFGYHEQFRDLQPGDFRGVRFLYGAGLGTMAQGGDSD